MKTIFLEKKSFAKSVKHHSEGLSKYLKLQFKMKSKRIKQIQTSYKMEMGNKVLNFKNQYFLPKNSNKFQTVMEKYG